MSEKLAKPVAKSVQKAATPDGTAREYFVVDLEYTLVSEFTNYIYMRARKIDVIYGSDNKVYIQNFFASPYITEPTWIEGTLSADGTTINVPTRQSFGTTTVTTNQGATNVDVCLVAYSGNTELSSITFTVDPDYGVLTCGDYLFMDAFLNGTDLGYLTQIYAPEFYPADNNILFEAPVDRQLTATGMLSGDISTTVTDYASPGLGCHFIKGLYPAYPDSWIIAFYDDNARDFIVQGQIIDDDVVGFPDDGSFLNNTQITSAVITNSMNSACTFTYGADDTYTQESGIYLMDLYYGSQGFDLTDLFTDIKLGVGTTGISSVTTEAKGEPVATEYYDLSGRRVDAAAKGVTIRVDKYADGTSKAVKTIK